MKQPVSKVEVTVSNRTILRVLGIVLATFLLFRVAANARHALELIFISAFLAVALNPAVTWIAHKLRIKSRAMATGLAYLVVVVILATFVSLFVPPLVRQTVSFVRTVPETLNSLDDANTSVGSFVKRYHLEAQVNGLSENIKERTKNFQEPVISTATRVGSTLISILTVLVLTFMMLTEGPRWVKKFWSLQRRQSTERDKAVVQRMYRVVTGYVNGQVLLAAMASFLGMTVLLISSTLLGVTINAVALAGIMFFTGLIPMIGQIIGGVIVVIACLFVSVPLAIIMAIFLIVYQQIENITLQPVIQAKYNELTPLLVFIAALVGIGFGGLIGAFIAIPAAGCAKILFQEYLSRREDRTVASS